MRKILLKLLPVLLFLAEYVPEYSEKKLVWIGFDMGWSAFRMIFILGSMFILIFLIWAIISYLFGK